MVATNGHTAIPTASGAIRIHTVGPPALRQGVGQHGHVVTELTNRRLAEMGVHIQTKFLNVGTTHRATNG